MFAGSEFGPLEGHILVIERVLYRLRMSGVRFHTVLHLLMLIPLFGYVMLETVASVLLHASMTH